MCARFFLKHSVLRLLSVLQFLLLTVLSAAAWTIATVCCVIPLNAVGAFISNKSDRSRSRFVKRDRSSPMKRTRSSVLMPFLLP